MAPRALKYSAKVEHQNWDRVLKHRLPSVEQASRALQDAMAIQPGTKMIGHLPVMLWELPETPQETAAEISARNRKAMQDFQAVRAAQMTGRGRGRARSLEEDFSDDSDDDETSGSEDIDDSQDPAELLWRPGQGGEMSDGADEDVVYERIDEPEAESGNVDCALFEHVDFNPSNDLEPDAKVKCDEWLNNKNDQLSPPTHKRKREESPPPPRSQRRTLKAKKEKIVIDLTDSPEADPVKFALATLQQVTARTTNAQSLRPQEPASPPPRYMTPPGRLTTYKKAPVYWMTMLSRNLIKWLEQAETRSCQTQLSHLELHVGTSGSGESKLLLGFEAEEYAKMKLSRIQLPAWVQLNYGPLKLLDWFVLEVIYQPGTHRYADSEVRHPKTKSIFEIGPPYWILAFPAEAITSSKIEHQRPDCTLQGKQMSGKEKAMKKPLKSEKSVQVMAMMLGTKGMVPLLHGRHVEKKFADEFVLACAEGQGVLVLKTVEGFPLGGNYQHQ